METNRKRYTTALVMILMLFGTFELINCTEATPPQSTLFFQKMSEGENYTGNILRLGGYNDKLEKFRITLYDDNLSLIETGLLSEYSQNTLEGLYLDFRDNNNDGILGAEDTFFVFGKEEVQPTWGVVLTYEPDGHTITSNTLSGERFLLEEENDEDHNPSFILLFIGLEVCVIIVILGFTYKLGK